ncbi:MAG: aminotransferase class III-fold pyridoxal phosphate-dependent enzyme [Chloroflexi bacterium]|nr:MAG: aminotransferase class III-fold pyridoxal phosphate-dependent enzyme [Chloroflexota bacterium]
MPDTTATWRERDAELIAPAYSRYSDLVVESADGAHLHTVDGRDILDFGCGIAVTSLGHRHPAVVAAVHEQVDRLWHTSVTTLHPKMIEAAAGLVAVTPEGLDQVFFSNSGAEAVEGAVKLTRRATGRTELIAFTGAFHGRTYGAMTLPASRAKYRTGVGPFLPHAPDQRCPIAEGEDLQRLFATTVPPETVAAIIVEPVLGEGGIVVPPATFLPSLRTLCDQHGILLIADEIQCGLARTGRMFAVEHTGTDPDVMTLAKALGNGLPVAAIVARHAVMRHWQRGEHGTTFGGNPVACAAVIAVIEVMTRERIAERAAALGRRTMERLQAWRNEVPGIGDIRGLGLMIGLEFMQGDRPDGAVVRRIRARALERGLLTLTCGTDDNVIRIMPPLTIPEAELDAGLDILESAVMEEAPQ